MNGAHAQQGRPHRMAPRHPFDGAAAGGSLPPAQIPLWSAHITGAHAPMRHTRTHTSTGYHNSVIAVITREEASFGKASFLFFT